MHAAVCAQVKETVIQVRCVCPVSHSFDSAADNLGSLLRCCCCPCSPVTPMPSTSMLPLCSFRMRGRLWWLMTTGLSRRELRWVDCACVFVCVCVCLCVFVVCGLLRGFVSRVSHSYCPRSNISLRNRSVAAAEKISSSGAKAHQISKTKPQTPTIPNSETRTPLPLVSLPSMRRRLIGKLSL